MLGALTLIGCGGDDIIYIDSKTDPVKPDPVKPDPSKPDGYDNLRDSVGTATRPTDWKAVDIVELDPTQYDRIVVTSNEIPVEIDLNQDIMGVFINGECRDFALPVVEATGKTVFKFVVMPKIDESPGSINIELRYFSAKNKRIYIAEPFSFSNGTMSHGTLSGEGYKAIWK